MSYQCPRTKCPYCHVAKDGIVDMTAGEKERAPMAGDISLCFICGNWSVFTADLQLAEPDEMKKMIVEKSSGWKFLSEKANSIKRARRMQETR